MKELSMRTKIEMVFLCKGIRWSYYWQEKGLNPSRVNREFEEGAREDTLRLVWDDLGYEVKTGFEEVKHDMSLRKKVEFLCKMNGISLTDLAKATGDTATNLTQKLTRERMNLDEWNKIGEVLGVKVDLVLRGDDFTI